MLAADTASCPAGQARTNRCGTGTNRPTGAFHLPTHQHWTTVTHTMSPNHCNPNKHPATTKTPVHSTTNPPQYPRQPPASLASTARALQAAGAPPAAANKVPGGLSSWLGVASWLAGRCGAFLQCCCCCHAQNVKGPTRVLLCSSFSCSTSLRSSPLSCLGMLTRTCTCSRSSESKHTQGEVQLRHALSFTGCSWY